MSRAIYYPVLRAKSGEFEAYGHLSPPVRAFSHPLFDIPKPKSGAKPDQLDAYLIDMVKRIKVACGATNPVFIDLNRLDLHKKTISDLYPIELVFRASRQLRMQAIPVAGPGRIRGYDNGNLAVVSRIGKEQQSGAGFRVPVREYLQQGELGKVVLSASADIKISDSQIDLLLDLEGMERMPEDMSSTAQLDRYLTSELQHVELDAFRTVVLIGSSVPQVVGKEFAESPYRGDRTEMKVWKTLASRFGPAILRYGDYGVITPYQNEGSASSRPPSRVRMATPDEIISYRGWPEEDHRPVCQQVCEDRAIYGQVESWGRKETIRCAKGIGSPGNSSNWVARDTNMHIESTLQHLIDYIGIDKAEIESSVKDIWKQESLLAG